MTKSKVVYVCRNCGYDSPKWNGRCPSCGEWNTFTEEVVSAGGRSHASHAPSEKAAEPVAVVDLAAGGETRMDLHDDELNRVLGGGLVPGSLVLLGGEPGIGKSTLILQTVLRLGSLRTLYVSGEESAGQIKMRADRIGRDAGNCYVYCDTSLENIFSAIKKVGPQLVVVDSIQTVELQGVPTAAGSIPQVRSCASRLQELAKTLNISVFLTGHVTKTGDLAGPRTLEHVVDTVLYLEGDSGTHTRIIRSVKNRFGPSHELGLFEMKENGMVEVERAEI